jgi:hypothetical protein
MLDKIFSFRIISNFTCKAPTSFTFSHRRFVIFILQVLFGCIFYKKNLWCFCLAFASLFALLYSTHKTFHCCWIVFVAFKFLMLFFFILQVLVAFLSSTFKQLFDYVLHLSPNCISLSSTFTKVLFFCRFCLWSSHSHKVFQCVLHLIFGYASFFK